MATSATAADATPLVTTADAALSALATGSSSCSGCKFLRRRCIQGCIFAPYFRHPRAFAAIHTIFGAINVSKLLAGLSVNNLQIYLVFFKEVNNLQVQNWFHPETNSNPIIPAANVSFSGLQEDNFQHDPNPIILATNVNEFGFIVFGNYYQH
ncbi:LOB domain-containing protein 33-like [Diospyros lotus]|uniref:LOB domain-containing protein 33-like n=1 Tax=Diospyros lotus TaxID=55363 RepID=UPI002257377F|nr:LOB domain-containing protein 33-like [Diospyros lotus]